VARAAVLGRLSWRVAEIVEARPETATARTLVLDVAGWPGHLPGQHVDVRLTAEDGYSAQRSYSIASASDGPRLELAVQAVPEGEVSSYLTEVAAPGDRLEVRGPLGGWFVWHPHDGTPVQLVAGGSGIVPLMAMIRTRARSPAPAPFRLLYSARGPADVLFAAELKQRSRSDAGLVVDYAYTRRTPSGWPRPPGRVDAALLAAVGWSPEVEPASFVCGPTGFVEAVAALLVGSAHDPARIKTERFGPTGGAG
jgi:ferredoxin-NADP reductase